MSCELLKRLQHHDANAIALSDGYSCQLSYGELLGHVEATVKLLRENKVSGVMICCDNSIGHVVLDLACFEANIWSLQIPYYFTTDQLQHAIKQSGCSHIISEQPNKDAVQINIADATFQMSGTPYPITGDGVLPGTVKVTYTSGSTATSKGLCLSESNLMSPVKAIHSALPTHTLSRHLVVLPQSVLLESVAGIYASLYTGICCVVPPLRDVSAAASPGEAIQQQLIRQQASSVILVPELLGLLVDACVDSGSTPTATEFIAVGGSRVPQNLVDRAHAVGLPVYEGYGLSEAGSVVSLNLPGASRPGTVGRILSHQRVSIAPNNEILLHEPGFLGYCNSESTPQMMATNSFATGDLGSIDGDGYLRIEGRLKNVLITSMGRNVSPEWVESEINSLSGINQVLVYGDANSQLSAFVVTTLDHEQIEDRIAMANSRLPAYARIGSWQQVAAFTVENGQLTANGKIKRHAILDAHRHIVANNSYTGLIASA